MPDFSDNEKTLSVAVDTGRKPFVYMLNNSYAGFETEVMYMFCEKYGYNPVISDVPFASGLAGLSGGKFDLVAGGITSISKEKIEEIGNGGMSWAPVHKKNLELVRYVHTKSEGKLPIIGVGGIMTPEDAKAMLDAGATLVQVYTGFVYNGPSFVGNICKHLLS